MIFRLTDDLIERRLELIGRRTFAQAITQTLIALLIFSFLVAYFALIGSNFLSKLPPDWLGRFDCWWRLLAALAIMGLPAIVIGGFILRAVMTFSDGWHRFIWDGRAGELVALRRGGLLGRSTSTTIPLAEIRRIDLHAAPGGQNLALAFTFHSGKQLQREPLVATVHVHHVDRREEAMDLAFRIARMCGVNYYAIESSDLRNVKLRLLREPKDFNRFQPIPESNSAVRYEENAVSLPVPAPAARVGKFRRESFEQSVSGTRLVEWQPGQRVHFHQPAPDAATYWFAAAIAVGVGGFVAYQFAPLAKEWLPWWATMFIAIAASPLITCLVIWLWNPEREVVFDWLAGRVTWRVGSRSRSAPFGAIEQFALCGLKERVHRKKQPDYTNFSCRLEMCVESRRIAILESDKFRELPDAPAERLGPLTAGLSESLNVPWQWREYV